MSFHLVMKKKKSKCRHFARFSVSIHSFFSLLSPQLSLSLSLSLSLPPDASRLSSQVLTKCRHCANQPVRPPSPRQTAGKSLSLSLSPLANQFLIFSLSKSLYLSQFYFILLLNLGCLYYQLFCLENTY